MRTKTDEVLAAAEHEHSSDEERAEVIARTRRFKSSWIELAEALTEVRKGGRFKKWGYGSFDEYTKRELHLKPETVEKLTGSFVFLQRTAPEVLSRDGLKAPIPSYQSIDFWRKAEAEGALVATLSEIRREVLDDHVSAPAIARKYKEIIFPIGDEERQEKETAQLRNAAKRLAELLEETGTVPKRLAGEVKDALEKLIEALTGDEAKAA